MGITSSENIMFIEDLTPINLIINKLRYDKSKLLMLDYMRKYIIKHGLLCSWRNDPNFTSHGTYHIGIVKIHECTVEYWKKSKGSCYFCNDRFKYDSIQRYLRDPKMIKPNTYHDGIYYTTIIDGNTICEVSGYCKLFLDIACTLSSIFEIYLILLYANLLDLDIANIITTILVQNCINLCILYL